MSVLTISRDIGSGGFELAGLVAEATGYRIADKSVIELIMREYGFSDFDERCEKKGGFWSAEEEAAERTLRFLDQVVRALAKADRTIIVGRGGFVPLAGFADVIHARVTAPFSFRVERVMQGRSFASREEAERYVDRRDKARRGFVARYYGARWDDAAAFDLVADLATFDVADIAKLLAGALRRLDSAAPRPQPSATNLTVDSVLMEATIKKLESAEAATETDD